MEHLDAYKCKSDYHTVYSVDMDHIVQNIDNYQFNSIAVDPSVEIEEGLLEFTSDEHPISIGHDYVFKNYLGLDSKYYEANKKEMDKYLIEIAKRVQTPGLYVDIRLINDKLKKVLMENKEIKALFIGQERVR